MKRTFIIPALVAMILPLSCTKDVFDDSAAGGEKREVTFMVEGSSADAVSIFDSEGNKKFVRVPVLAENAFQGVVRAEESYMAISPYNPSYSLAAGGLRVTMSDKVNPVPGVADPARELSAASFSGSLAELQPLVSYFAFSLDGDDITTVTLRGKGGEQLGGDAAITISDDGSASAAYIADGEKAFKLTMAPSAGALSKGAYLIPIIASAFPEGLEVEFAHSSDNRIAVLSLDGMTAAAGTPADLGEWKSDELAWSKTSILRFVESPLATEAAWPFKEALSGNGTYTTLQGGYQVTIHTEGTPACSLDGLVFGSAEGDYIEFPAFEGFALNKVTVVTGNDGSTGGEPAVVTSEGTVLSPAWDGAKTAGTEHVWSFKGIHNKVCRLQLTSAPGDDGLKIRKLTFSYRPAADVEYSVDAAQTAEAEAVVLSGGKFGFTMKGSYTPSLSGVSNYKAGFEYRAEGQTEWISVECAEATEAFSYSVSQLDPGAYEYRAWAFGNVDIDRIYGEVKTVSTTKTIVLDFDTLVSNPCPMSGIWTIVTNPTASNPAEKVLEGDVDGYHFYFKTECSFGIGLRTSSGRSGLSFSRSLKVATAGYCKLPAIPSHVLAGIDITFLDKNTLWTLNPGVNDDSTASGDALVTGASATTAKKEYSYPVEGAAVNTSYYFCTTHANCTICKMVLKYELTEQ